MIAIRWEWRRKQRTQALQDSLRDHADSDSQNAEALHGRIKNGTMARVENSHANVRNAQARESIPAARSPAAASARDAERAVPVDVPVSASPQEARAAACREGRIWVERSLDSWRNLFLPRDRADSSALREIFKAAFSMIGSFIGPVWLPFARAKAALRAKSSCGRLPRHSSDPGVPTARRRPGRFRIGVWADSRTDRDPE